MVKINYCPSCGAKLTDGSFICPVCNADIGDFFDSGYIVVDDDESDAIELFEAESLDVQSGDEIVIVVPQDATDDELVIDLDKLGIDVENLSDDVNIVIQVEGEVYDTFDFFDEDDDRVEANQWFFDDDPYDIVYYEFVNDED